jgi:hypothetical protein
MKNISLFAKRIAEDFKSKSSTAKQKLAGADSKI